MAICPICGLEFLAHKTLLVHNNLVHEIKKDPDLEIERKEEALFVKKEPRENQKRVKTEIYLSENFDLNEVSAFEEIKDEPFDDKSIIKRFIHKALREKTSSTDHTYSQNLKIAELDLDLPPEEEDCLQDNVKAPKKKIFFCKICNKEFENKASFTDHKVDAHSSRAQCNQCGKSYGTERGLWQHQRLTHKGIKFTCQFCSKNYVKKAALEKHLQTHILNVFTETTTTISQ